MQPDAVLRRCVPPAACAGTLTVMAIRLRPLRDADLDDVFRWEGHPEAIGMAAFTRPDPTDRAAFDAHHQRVRADPANTVLAIERDEEFVGTIGSFTIEDEREITYWIDPALWGRGIASEAVRLFLHHERQRPLYARVAEHNLGSSTVLVRNGFQKIGEEVSWAAGVGEHVTEHIYRLDEPGSAPLRGNGARPR
jgi:RimJ/RimL family protein N-acetyltransferase